jgi:hypothetical protein
MSIITKIIDRATRHNNTTEEKPQRRSFFGFGSSTNTSATTIPTADNKELSLKKSSSSHSTQGEILVTTYVFILTCYV